VRVNAKSTSVSLGGKGMRYTVNSKGRRTATARVPGTGMSVQHTSAARKNPPRRAVAPQASRATSAPAAPPKPGLFASKGEKRLYGILARAQGMSAATAAARCEQAATEFPAQRIAALTLAGLFALGTDRDMAIRTLGQVFASRVEIADDEFLRRYAPVKSFRMRANGRDVAVPLSRDLVGMRLVQLHTLARQFDWAESAAAELKDTPVAQELRRMLTAARGNASPGEPPGHRPSRWLGNGSPWGERPAWMQDGVQAALLGGHEDLEVVGESHYQDNLRRLTGCPSPDQRVRQEIHAVPVAEDDNPHDPDAVAVWIDGLQVGHLSREDARRYRPGLLAQERAHGKPIALAGVIAGGGIRADGPGMLGVFLRYDPADFGYQRQPAPPPPGSRMRTALSDALATDAADDSYDLGWMAHLPDDDIRAIPVLRKLLGAETSILSRHYLYQHLEAALYRSRNAFASALGEYDEACRLHDAEMDAIRQACMEKWGKVPHLDTYRQMAIRQQKAHDYRQALWWAERGLSIYGSDCGRPEDVEDLRQRAATYRAKLRG